MVSCTAVKLMGPNACVGAQMAVEGWVTLHVSLKLAVLTLLVQSSDLQTLRWMAGVWGCSSVDSLQ